MSRRYLTWQQLIPEICTVRFPAPLLPHIALFFARRPACSYTMTLFILANVIGKLVMVERQSEQNSFIIDSSRYLYNAVHLSGLIAHLRTQNPSADCVI